MTPTTLIEELLALPAHIATQENRVLQVASLAVEAKDALADSVAEVRLGRNDEGFALLSGKNAEERDAQLRQFTISARRQVVDAERRLEQERAVLQHLRDRFTALRTVATLIGREAEKISG